MTYKELHQYTRVSCLWFTKLGYRTSAPDLAQEIDVEEVIYWKQCHRISLDSLVLWISGFNHREARSPTLGEFKLGFPGYHQCSSWINKSLDTDYVYRPFALHLQCHCLWNWLRGGLVREFVYINSYWSLRSSMRKVTHACIFTKLLLWYAYYNWRLYTYRPWWRSSEQLSKFQAWQTLHHLCVKKQTRIHRGRPRLCYYPVYVRGSRNKKYKTF